MDSYYIPPSREEREAEERHKKDIERFYSLLQRGGEEVKRFTESPPADEKLFALAQAQVKAWDLSETQKENCQKYLNKAKENMKKGLLFLGPNIYEERQKLIDQSRKNYWAWLKARCELEFYIMQEKKFLELAREINFPTQGLEGQKKEKFCQCLKNEFTMDDIARIIAPWSLDENLASVAKEYLLSLRCSNITMPDKEKEKLSFWFRSPSLKDTLHEIALYQQKFKKIYEECEKKQKKLNRQYNEFNSSQKIDKIWRDFEDKMKEEIPENFSLQELRDSGIAELPLAIFCEYENCEPENKQAEESKSERKIVLLKSKNTLFDIVANQYLKANSQELRSLLRLLLKHGDKPSTKFLEEKKMDWSLLCLVSKNIQSLTSFSEETRQVVEKYSHNTEQNLNNSCFPFFTNKTIKEARRKDIHDFIETICWPEEKNDWLSSDKRLADKIEKYNATAQRGCWPVSSLYSDLNQVMKLVETGELLAVINRDSIVSQEQELIEPTDTKEEEEKVELLRKGNH